MGLIAAQLPLVPLMTNEAMDWGNVDSGKLHSSPASLIGDMHGLVVRKGTMIDIAMSSGEKMSFENIHPF